MRDKIYDPFATSFSGPSFGARVTLAEGRDNCGHALPEHTAYMWHPWSGAWRRDDVYHT